MGDCKDYGAISTRFMAIKFLYSELQKFNRIFTVIEGTIRFFNLIVFFLLHINLFKLMTEVTIKKN